MKVYKAIAAVVGEMSKIGISKDSTNSSQGYKFRGIDAVYGALSPLLAKHGLCVLPRVLDRTVTEQPTRSGGVMFYTVLKVEFDFVAAEDGSKHTVCTIGEAMDTGDKSSNKAMSAAYKYACFQAFCIPTEGDNDADATTHEAAQARGYDEMSGEERAKKRNDKAAFTKSVNEYSERVKKSVDEGNTQKLAEILNEVRAAGNDFRVAVWTSLPTAIQNFISDKLPKAA